MLAVEVATAGRHLKALGCRRHRVAVGEVGSTLLLKVALLMVVFLLLEILDLGVQVQDGIGVRGRSCRNLAQPRGAHRGHDGVLVVHHEGWVVRIAHDGIGVVVLVVYHALASPEVAEVKLHFLAHASDGEKVAEFIVGAHMVVQVAPAPGTHDGGGQVGNCRCHGFVVATASGICKPGGRVCTGYMMKGRLKSRCLGRAYEDWQEYWMFVVCGPVGNRGGRRPL